MQHTFSRIKPALPDFATALILPVSLAFAFLILRPGLSGSFLFDDFPNLAPLNNADGLLASYNEIISFLTGNISGPTGRPISLLTFLINQYGWPSNATPFLWTNLMVHLLVGVAVFQFTRLCIHSTSHYRKKGIEKNANVLALLAASLWLILPLQISTVFYVIQRMTQLSALFVLISLSLYICGRRAVERGRPKSGTAFLISCPFAALIGFYAKENAAIVPVLILVTEATILSAEPPDAAKNALRRFLICVYGIVPTAIIALYLAVKTVTSSPGWNTGVGRVFLQGQVLLDYIYKLAVPQSSTAGLFYDSFIATPPDSTTVLISVAGWITITTTIALALFIRKERPLLAFGILFFFSSHLIESSGLSLDLYYEHRNYLPSIGLVIAGLSGISILYTKKKKIAIFALITLFAANAAQAHLRADLWGTPRLASTVWTLEAPDSSSAWLRLSFIANQYGDVATLRYALMQWQNVAPKLLAPRLLTLRLNCPKNPLDAKSVTSLVDMAKDTPAFNGLSQYLEPLIRQAANGECHGLTVEQIYYIIRALIENPKTGIWQKKYLWTLSGYILATKGLGNDAYHAFERSNELVHDSRMKEKQKLGLCMAGFPKLAEKLDSEKFSDRRPTRFGALHARTLLSYVSDWKKESSFSPLLFEHKSSYASCLESNR